MDAITTYRSYLMISGDSGWDVLVPIKEDPDLGGEPEMLDKTTMSDGMRQYEPGIQDTGALQYTTNYNKTDFAALKALEGKTLDLAEWFGTDSSGAPDGSDGKFQFRGKLTVWPVGGSVNQIRDMRFSIALESEIEFVTT